MKKIILTLQFLLSISILTWAQSRNYNQEFFDLIKTQKWFEIDRYYELNKDSINNEFVKLFYIAETGKVFNQPAQSIDAYKQLLDKNLLNDDTPTLIGNFGQAVVNVCINEQEFARGEMLCKKMITILHSDTTFEATSLIQDLEILVEQFKEWNNKVTIPEIIDKDPYSLGEVELAPSTSDNGIYFNAKWNGVNLRTFFDTGAGTCFAVNRAIAEKIGVKLNITDTILMNGNIKGLMGAIDSLTFGKFSIKNVPVYVNIEDTDRYNPKQRLCDSIINSRLDIVLGMPIIKKLGVIEFDFEKNIMSFPKSNKTSNQRNIYISAETYISNDGYTTWKDNLYLNMKICNDNSLTFFDTGGQEGLSINTDFFETHNQHILVETQTSITNTAVGGCNQESISTRYEYKCPQIEIQVQDKNITLINDCTVAIDKENDNKHGTEEGGFLGNDIFKYCKKAVFDFNNMVFSIE